jgi:hypothetical protein
VSGSSVTLVTFFFDRFFYCSRSRNCFPSPFSFSHTSSPTTSESLNAKVSACDSSCRGEGGGEYSYIAVHGSERCASRMTYTKPNMAARNGRPPVVRPVTWEGAHSCAPSGCVLRWSLAMRDGTATRNGRPPIVQSVTSEGAHSCAPCYVRRRPAAIREILATRNGRPPVVPFEGKGRSFRTNHFKLMFYPCPKTAT